MQNHKVTKTIQKQLVETADHSITNCVKCEFTCHDPCEVQSDDKEGCSVMKGRVCTICPFKCGFEHHQNGTKIYKYVLQNVVETIKDMMTRYNVAATSQR